MDQSFENKQENIRPVDRQNAQFSSNVGGQASFGQPGAAQQNGQPFGQPGAAQQNGRPFGQPVAVQQHGQFYSQPGLPPQYVQRPPVPPYAGTPLPPPYVAAVPPKEKSRPFFALMEILCLAFGILAFLALSFNTSVMPVGMLFGGTGIILLFGTRKKEDRLSACGVTALLFSVISTGLLLYQLIMLIK